MAKRILKVLISLGFFVSAFFWHLIMGIFRLKPGATCSILYYHSVPDSQRGAFAHQMDILAKLTKPIPVDRVLQLIPGEYYSCVTFDDGFENVIDNAIPELQKRGIPAAVFLTVGLLGQRAEWWPADACERHQRIAPVERWRQLPASSISIGSHSMTHRYLAKLDETEARRELRDSRVILQELIQRKITTFSFPYGDFTDSLVTWCRDAGYEHAFTSRPEKAFQNTDDFVTGRIGVDPADWDLEFRLKLLGAYRWLPVAMYCKHKICSLPVFSFHLT